jgi:mannan polymerase II complex MNN11 subunit
LRAAAWTLSLSKGDLDTPGLRHHITNFLTTSLDDHDDHGRNLLPVDIHGLLKKKRSRSTKDERSRRARTTTTMHYAYPPRKSSNPAPFRPRSTRLPFLRRSRLKTIAIVLGALLFFLYLINRPSHAEPYHEHAPRGTPPVVIVTVVDSTEYRPAYLETIKMNRELYAKKHGYEAFVVRAEDYDTKKAPASWANVLAMRHAITKFPDCTYLWFLDEHAFIMDPEQSLEQQVVSPRTLESLMIRDYPVVPPDSIIKTFSHLRGEDADLIISQDKEGLNSGSFVLRNGDWAKFFTETWFDPKYRSYNFEKAQRHALEHIVQWHPTILSKLALVPQKTLGSYSHSSLGKLYQDGDFVVMFPECTTSGQDICETESAKYWGTWKKAFNVE